MSNEKVIIIGAGLAGSLLAIYLAKRGIEVDVYEARGDMRHQSVAAGRSINLALSDRGIAALREVGMDEYMLAEAMPMYGRLIHSPSGETKLLPYSGREGEYINSVSRGGLNIALINEAEKYAGVRFFFNEGCVDLDIETGEAILESGKRVAGSAVIATDGAGSAVRNAIMHGGVERFNFSQAWLDHGYKELVIPSVSEFDVLPEGVSRRAGRFVTDENALHIWPRQKFMMIALPNFDGSFTCTLFLAHKSPRPAAGGKLEPAFDQLADETAVMDFFKREFPDAVPLMPTLTHDFFANPTGNLGTVKCFPWNIDGKVLLLGDAAHAVVPFYGQGMNCAFEDVRVLDQLIEKRGTEWERVFEEYGVLRKVNTDAIADMAEENFYEMRDATADAVFQRKRALETTLEQEYPDYFSKYSMVTFREDLPYFVAREMGNAQDRLLMEICGDAADIDDLDLDDVIKMIRTNPVRS
jgi:kynurenine 3-monooxygenase